MLTPEERQRIEEEEQKKHAEEQYRAEVRKNLNGPTLTVTKKQTPFWTITLCILGIAIVVFALISLNSAKSRPTQATPADVNTPTVTARYVPASQKLIDGQVIVKARGYLQYPVEITPDMRDVHVAGQFTASGGSGNDIAAVLATAEDFENWINGHQSRVYYSTDGKKTTDRFDVRLAPGHYVFALSNQFSALTDKQVYAQVTLNYSQLSASQ